MDFKCSRCSREFASGQWLRGCRTCNYDLCKRCAEPVGAWVALSGETLKVEQAFEYHLPSYTAVRKQNVKKPAPKVLLKMQGAAGGDRAAGDDAGDATPSKGGKPKAFFNAEPDPKPSRVGSFFKDIKSVRDKRAAAAAAKRKGPAAEYDPIKAAAEKAAAVADAAAAKADRDAARAADREAKAATKAAAKAKVESEAKLTVSEKVHALAAGAKAGSAAHLASDAGLADLKARFEAACFDGGELTKAAFAVLVTELLGGGTADGRQSGKQPSERDLDHAFSLADVDDSGLVSWAEFVPLYRLAVAGEVTGLSSTSFFSKGAVKRKTASVLDTLQDHGAGRDAGPAGDTKAGAAARDGGDTEGATSAVPPGAFDGADAVGAAHGAVKAAEASSTASGRKTGLGRLSGSFRFTRGSSKANQPL